MANRPILAMRTHQRALLDVPYGNFFEGGRDEQPASAIINDIGVAAYHAEAGRLFIAQVCLHHWLSTQPAAIVWRLNHQSFTYTSKQSIQQMPCAPFMTPSSSRVGYGQDSARPVLLLSHVTADNVRPVC